MRIVRYDSLRWADQENQHVLVGQANVRSRALFDVISPMPMTWRVIAGCRCNDALNFGLPLRLVINIGIGSFATQAPFDIAFNAIFNFEIPGQVMSAFVQINDVIAATDDMVFGAGIAPNTPWEGTRVMIDPTKVEAKK